MNSPPSPAHAKTNAKCSECSTILPKAKFSNRQWKVSQSKRKKSSKLTGARCILCVKAAAPHAASSKSSAESTSKTSQSKRKRAGDDAIDEHHRRRSNKTQKTEASNAVPRLSIDEAKKTKQSRKKFQFQWFQLPVSIADERKLSSVLVRKGEYGPLNDDRRQEIQNVVESTECAMNMEQALSYRTCLLQQKTMRNHFLMAHKANEMERLYTTNGVSIVELARRFDFPPMNVLRTVLGKMKGMKKANIKACLRDPSKFKNDREKHEFREAEAMDNVSGMDQTKSLAASEKFEEDLVKWFEERGVRLQRQEEIKKEQKHRHGRAICTPDILFLDDVEINGEAVAWMDAKNFYGADTEMHRKNTEKQVQKYIVEWGKGAVAYRYGFSEKLSILKCALLDGGCVL